MCTAGGSNKGPSPFLAMGKGSNLPQYKQSDQAKSASKQYQGLDERYKRWAAEDLGSFPDIDRRVSEAEKAFNTKKEAQLRSLGWKPDAEIQQRQTASRNFPLALSPRGALRTATAVNPVMNSQIRQLQQQQFNAGQMRQDLVSQAVMDRVNSGVYNRGYQVTGTGQTSQASVVAGGGGRAQARDRLSISKAGGGTPTGPIGTNLNIGK
jgi:hypothetical protein